MGTLCIGMAAAWYWRLASEEPAEVSPPTRPVAWVGALGLTGIGLARPLSIGLIHPAVFYLLPLFPTLMVGWTLLWFAAGVFSLAVFSRRWPGLWSPRALWTSSLVVVIGNALWVSGLGLTLAFLVSWPAFEHARSGETRGEDVWVGVYSFDRVGWYPDLRGEPTYVLELCPSLDGTVCFPHGGSGFLHVAAGSADPDYYTETSGRLLGGWSWYTDD